MTGAAGASSPENAGVAGNAIAPPAPSARTKRLEAIAVFRMVLSTASPSDACDGLRTDKPAFALLCGRALRPSARRRGLALAEEAGRRRRDGGRERGDGVAAELRAQPRHVERARRGARRAKDRARRHDDDLAGKGDELAGPADGPRADLDRADAMHHHRAARLHEDLERRAAHADRRVRRAHLVGRGRAAARDEAGDALRRRHYHRARAAADVETKRSSLTW